LFAAVVGLLDVASRPAPVVLVLDDLQWADKPILLLLKHLSVTLGEQRVLLVGTYRDSDLHATHPLLDILAALRREVRTHRVDLSGLSDGDVIAAFEGLAGQRMDRDGIELAHAVRRETGGNPFFVSEMLAHLAESGWIYRDSGGRWVAREGLEDAGLLGRFDQADDYVATAAHMLEMLGDIYHLALTWLRWAHVLRNRRAAGESDKWRGGATAVIQMPRFEPIGGRRGRCGGVGQLP
jgi:predicted ATPase